MTKNFYRTGNYEVDHSTFGGAVYSYDFDGYNSMTDIIGRIISDKNFDKSCKKNIEGRNKNKNYNKEN